MQHIDMYMEEDLRARGLAHGETNMFRLMTMCCCVAPLLCVPLNFVVRGFTTNSTHNTHALPPYDMADRALGNMLCSTGRSRRLFGVLLRPSCREWLAGGARTIFIYDDF